MQAYRKLTLHPIQNGLKLQLNGRFPPGLSLWS